MSEIDTNAGCCLCPSGVCRDPWAYLCVGVTEAATEWAVRHRDGFIEEGFGPHKQTARQAAGLIAGWTLMHRRIGETEWRESPTH